MENIKGCRVNFELFMKGILISRIRHLNQNLLEGTIEFLMPFIKRWGYNQLLILFLSIKYTSNSS